MNLKKTILTITAIIFAISSGILTDLQAAEFSADMETRSRGQIVVKGKIFIKDSLSRHEMNQGGRKVILINHPDKGVTWTLMPQEKSYLEMPIDQEDIDEMPDNWNQELIKGGRALGSETINGIKCNKYELVDEGEKITYWIAKKEGIPVRVVTSDSEVNYRNIRTGQQPDHLFQIPADYRKFAMPQIPGMPGMFNIQAMPEGQNIPSYPGSK